MTNEEQILMLADSLNRTLIILDGLAFDAQNLSGFDLSNLRKDLFLERERVAKVIDEYD